MRRELTRRPALLGAFALALGMALPREPLLIMLLVGLVVVGESNGQRAFVIGAAVCGMALAPREQPQVLNAKFIEGEARIATVPRLASSGQSAILEIDDMRLATFLPLAPALSLGDRLRVRGVAKPAREGSEAFLRGRGVVGRLDWSDAYVLSHGPIVFAYGIAWRDSFTRFTSRTLTPLSKEAADALCFNVDSTLDPTLKEALRRTGTVHIVSASGLHVGLFAFFLQSLLSKMPIDRRWQLAALLVVLLLYMGATGMRPPVVRAVVMAAAILTAYLWRREGDLLSALGLATVVQLLWDPWSVLDMGLHLSFTAVLALGLFVHFDSGFLGIWSRIRRHAVQTVHASVVASLATAPIIAWSFGYVSLISPIANLMIAPLVLVIVPCSLVGWACSAAPALGQTVMLPVEYACRLMTFLVQSLASLPLAAIDLPAFSAWWIPVWYLALAGLWRKHVRPA